MNIVMETVIHDKELKEIIKAHCEKETGFKVKSIRLAERSTGGHNSSSEVKAEVEFYPPNILVR